ncbi:MAG: sulfite exporter TauE/SafE family protein [Myxococcota bacterium]|nr:sulfite exporter TauE/SafE family protein [Myxococcota bacterium]
MDASAIALLFGGGVVAGIVNTLAGGGSMLTVPLLVMLGLPGTLANGTNRVGVLVQSLAATWRFRRDGVDVLASALPVLLPVGVGALVGALAVTQLADNVFERAFGLVMLAVLWPTLRPPRPAPDANSGANRDGWPGWLRMLVFFAIGVYGGSFQAGVGIALLLALGRSGYDLVTANAIKVLVVAVLTAIAVPVFVAQSHVAWEPAFALAAGFGIGGAAGARLAVRGGEALIRPVLVISVIALAARMLGFAS